MDKNPEGKFYVLGVRAAPWVLDSYETRARAQGAIKWQNSPDGAWAIAKRTGANTFQLDDGREVTVERGPYTQEAFAAFKAEWPVN